MPRGDVYVVSVAGEYGKPRPAVVVHADLFDGAIGSFTVCPLTTELTDAPLLRLSVEPNAENGLKRTSQIMVDKVSSVAERRIGKKIGRLDDQTLASLDRSLGVFLGLTVTVRR